VDTILTGNAAIALAARDAKVALGVGYPGTPSTEVLENLTTLDNANAQWAPNEKVAMEVGVGVSYGGGRALVTMKHVGLNVAADPLFTVSYTGVSGGLVILVADDPGMHSSQNEQDSRHYARAAKIPMLEPSDSQEAYDFTRIAFELSEKFDTPVLLRTTTRLSHGKSTVRPSQKSSDSETKPIDNPMKYVMVPANAKRRHLFVEERTIKLQDYFDTSNLTQVEYRDKSLGIITSGISYQYVRDAVPNASILKLGAVWPLPMKTITDFAANIEKLFVIEELDPFIEEQLKAAGIKCIGKERFPICGEFTPTVVAVGMGVANPIESQRTTLPVRPPSMCPGCPHRGVFRTLKRMKLIVSGDIGCYTLGVMPPLMAMDSCVCMGASIGIAHGMEKAGVDPSTVVAVIGDSTFLHSGMTGLLDMVYNGSKGTLIILDNGTTAMTGRQDHPGTGKVLSGEQAPHIDLLSLVKSLGVIDAVVIDPYDIPIVEKSLNHALKHDGPSVIITNRPCMLIPHEKYPKVQVIPENCKYCGACLSIGCPSISKVAVDVNGKSRIRPQMDPLLCTGCQVCKQMCKFDAIEQVSDNTDTII
jgi:indolepyruvate ferredoxin oxidoreductase alpha subunit